MFRREIVEFFKYFIFSINILSILPLFCVTLFSSGQFGYNRQIASIIEEISGHREFIFVFYILAFIYLLSYLVPFVFGKISKSDIEAKKCLPIREDRSWAGLYFSVTDWVFVRGQIFKNSSSANLHFRAYIALVHVITIVITSAILILFFFDLLHLLDLEMIYTTLKALLGSLQCKTEEEKLRYSFGATVFFPTLYWYCYIELKKDYISKWVESSTQVFEVVKLGSRSRKAERFVALAILNKDLWAKRLFSSFFAAVVFREYNTCKKSKLRDSYKDEKQLTEGFCRRKITESEIFDLLFERDDPSVEIDDIRISR